MKDILSNKNFRMLMLGIGDAILVFLCGLFSLLIRFEFIVSYGFQSYFNKYLELLPVFIVVTILSLIIFRLYNAMWSVASMREAILIGLASVLSSGLQLTFAVLLNKTLPRSYYILFVVFFAISEILWRFSYRIFRLLSKSVDKNAKRVMIVGAGEAGAALLKEIKTSKFTDAKVILFVDDSEYKIGKNLNGVNIYGDRTKIPELANKYRIDEIYVAVPRATINERNAIIKIASETNCKVKVLPGIYQLVNGEVSISKLRDIDIEDLLGREEVKTNVDDILGYVSGKVVLVTGAGGSIGSEICRQIATHNPKSLILLDIYENTTYDLQNELKKNFPKLNLVTLIASVRNYHRIDTIFNEYKIDIVFHAAAHKHVPLMEDSPCEAIKNNCLGTLNVCTACDKYNIDRFILISTDKAVNPTNIMGASKRICEMIVQYMSKHSKTTFAAVRFGNVLGSNGSVVPLFKKQIAEGGPVTVTDPDIIRYFMTIPEAVSLVLQAGAYAKGSEIFVLDMGKPVKIVDMAKNLIKLSGYEPDVDIKIVFTGLRPGEKLYEELLMAEEGMKKTNNNRIFIGHQIDFDEDKFMANLNSLIDFANDDIKSIKAKVSEIVNTYNYKEDKDV